jgi:hypothetical protein
MPRPTLRLWLEYVSRHPRTMGIYDTLMVVQAFGRSVVTCELVVLKKLTAVAEPMA